MYTYSYRIENKDFIIIYDCSLTCLPHFIPEKWLLSLSMYWKRSVLQWTPVRLGQCRCSIAKWLLVDTHTCKVSCNKGIGIEAQEWNHLVRLKFQCFLIQKVFLWAKSTSGLSMQFCYLKFIYTSYTLDLFTHIIYPWICRHWIHYYNHPQ